MDLDLLLADFDGYEAASRRNANWLARQTARASAYSSLDDLADEQGSDLEVDATWRRSFEHNLRWLRGGLARTFIRNGCFVGSSVIDEMIFEAVAGGVADVAAAVFDAIIRLGLHNPGMIVFPLHGFGIAVAKTALVGGPDHLLQMASAGFIVISQTGDIRKTIELLDAGRAPLGIVHAFDAKGVSQYAAGDRLDWLHRNPLLAFRFSSYSHQPYENQAFYQLRMRTLTALIFVASLYAPARKGEMDTRIVNNQETLDIDHYLRLEVSPSLSRLEVERIPRNVDRLALAEASDVDVRISLAGWEALAASGDLDRTYAMLMQIETGYLTHQVLKRRKGREASLYSKITTSLDYFRRSFRTETRQSERTISLAIAFETLLTDSYSGGVTARIRRRVAICLEMEAEPAELIEAVEDLFDARGKFVHSGLGPEDLPLRDARMAYVACLSTVTRLAQGATLSDPMIGTLLGDRPTVHPFPIRLRRAWATLLGR
ncbi:HEPN domain-containing protein [Polymorphobacter megasporae]|uniref:HEPN domain-containing protein n=1 Tax=Glacieibacterium megasporae TaxID=2835787 RepID=UPI001C1E8C79|nr:HEPN domain-containing protein [Polymorphobacter megasporae]UAJ10629.1 hypothetical protein KTC28_02410 [Polymorphobacter megasporae]